MKPLVDTNILIDYMKGTPDAVTLVDRLDAPMVSIITHAELLIPCASTAAEKEVSEFLNNFITLPLDDDVVLEATRLKRHLLQTR